MRPNPPLFARKSIKQLKVDALRRIAGRLSILLVICMLVVEAFALVYGFLFLSHNQHFILNQTILSDQQKQMETYLMATIKRRVADLQRQIKYDTVDNSQLRKERFRGPSTTFAIMNKDTLSGADTRKLFDELGSGYEKGKRDCSQRGGNQDTSN